LKLGFVTGIDLDTVSLILPLLLRPLTSSLP